MTQVGIYEGRTQIPYGYSRFGYTRGGGKTWHGGIDLVGLDDTTIRMPYYHYANGEKKEITGTVVTARIVTDHSNRTWEWGYYVCVKFDTNQTPDAVNYLYFCHCAALLVKAGQKVKSGDALAIMGNTGNAALNDPPFKHCHLEARSTSTGTGIDPTAYSGTENAVGVYGSNEQTTSSSNASSLQVITIGPVSNSAAIPFWNKAKELKLGYESQYTGMDKTRQILTIGPASFGDADQIWKMAQSSGAAYKSEYVK